MPAQTARTFVISLVFCLGLLGKGFGQCDNTTQYPGYTISAPSPAGTSANINTCNFASEYAIIDGTVTGQAYTITSDILSDYITVRQGNSGGTVIASGPQPLTWTAPNATANYYIHFNTDSDCGTNSTCRETNIIAEDGPMTLSPSLVKQIATSSIPLCSLENKAIIKIEVALTGNTPPPSPIELTQLTIRTDGSTSPTSDISNIDIFYTGNVDVFNTNVTHGSALPANSGIDIIFGNDQMLLSGINHFWITYDLSASAASGNNIDALCNELEIDGVVISPSPAPNAPAGQGTITICPPSPGGVDNNIVTWLRADAGISTFGSDVTNWIDQSSAGTGTTVNGTPNFVAVGRNYNPVVNFTPSANREFLSIPDNFVQSFFCVAQLTDNTRLHTHMLVYDEVSFNTVAGSNCNLCSMHGGPNGSSSITQYHHSGYGTSSHYFNNSDNWRRNGEGTGISFDSEHTGDFDIVTGLGTGLVNVNSLFGGQADNLGTSFFGEHRDWIGPAGEMIIYSGSITTAEANRIESYLAIKYGITLGGNGSSTIGYAASDGTSIWPAATEYHYDVIGIGRDDTSGLTQKQSRTEDGATELYISGLAASNPTNSGSFSTDDSFLMLGRNTGALCATDAANLEKPSGQGLYSRLEREWKVVNTGHLGDFNLNVTLDPCADPLSVDPNHLRLLVDVDDNFIDATVFNSGDFGLDFDYTTGVISILDISTNIIPQGATRYITIASVDATTPLPIELLSFTSTCAGDAIRLDWTTLSEINNEYFQIERSLDGVQFEPIAIIEGAGNSSSTLTYTWTDFYSTDKTVYHRLKQVDFDGSMSYAGTVAALCSIDGNITMFPNPAKDYFQVEYYSHHSDVMQVEIRNVAGQLAYSSQFVSESSGLSRIHVDTKDLEKGMYAVSFIQKNGAIETKKLSILR